jgi:WD40 repeat protein
MTDHAESVTSLCLTDKYLLSSSEDKSVLIRDCDSNQVIGSLKGHRLGVQDVVTDGKFIFTGADDCTIKVWKWVV